MEVRFVQRGAEIDGKKLYEAHPGESYNECKGNVKRVLDESLA